MMKYALIIAFNLISLIASFTLAAASPLMSGDTITLVLRNANVLDLKRGEFRRSRDVVIRDGKIIALSPAGKKWNDAKEIDLKGMFIVPGLVDAHVHVTAHIKNNIETTYKHLEYFVQHGITTVRDASGDGGALLEAQKEIMEGKRIGADVYFSSFMAGDWYFNRDIHLRDSPYTPWEQLITPTTNLDSAMRVAKACGATGVKLYHSFDKDFLPRVVRAAKKQGLIVWGHAMMYPAKPLEVVRAGVEVISHVSMLEALTTDTLFSRRKTPIAYKDSVIAQLDIRDFCLAMKRRGAILDATLCVSADRDPWIFPLLKRIHKEGVKISAGTDQIVDLKRPYPRLMDELNYFVQKCGFTTLEAIRSATIVSAETVGQEKNIGSVTVGKKADLLVLSQNPLLDINNLKLQKMVIKDGLPVLPTR